MHHGESGGERDHGRAAGRAQSSARGCGAAAARSAPIRGLALTAGLACAAATTVATAQTSATSPADSAPARGQLVPLLGVEDEYRRDAQLFGVSTSGYLLRGGADQAPGDGLRWQLPYVRVARNSALPFSLNDGAAWAGRGESGLLRAGFAFRRGRLRVVAVPELTFARNGDFELLASTDAGRSAYSSPHHKWRASIDMPSRFGDSRLAAVALGQSSAGVTLGAAEIGVSSENVWWGPGRANALIMSNNAEGFAHLFARTARPLRTGIGDVEARYMLGVLSPSLFLERDLLDTQRAFSGAAVTLRPRRLPELTLGLTRAVVSATERDLQALGRALDVLTVWEPAPVDSTLRPRGDQLTGAFARWVLPVDHAELYGEWVRAGMPRELRELLLAPQDGRAYTIGGRYLRPLGTRTQRRLPARYLRFELELTNTEQSVVLRDRLLPAPFYTGLATREGYTHRGQVLGAAIGPGGSAQQLAVDHVTPRTSLGVVLGRIRWEAEALYQQLSPTFLRHDVSTTLGARASRRTRAADVRAEATWARRYNYLFQNGFSNPGGRRTVDITNLTFTLSVEPR